LLPTEEWKEEMILLNHQDQGFEVTEIDDWSFPETRDIFGRNRKYDL
jgi:hypothetical protein